ncbi:MAG: GNAT family N-acetyltransferase [Candidatus Thermoplasmatota archaeon]|jgi:GNAT superfamily N-acetyltransferase|nr:GNAT family N-acetyltransferase [Candidatus Thermoplasmatota archaeon]MDP7264595.1 GNAT family N-acetyltransferase [Candidatus Thermoplasmatota archaeon]
MTPQKNFSDRFTLSRVKAEDVGNVMELYKTSIVPLWNETGRAYDLDRVEENLRNNIDNPQYFMQIMHNPEKINPIGYLAWEKHSDHTSNHMVAHLRMILVRPNHRRQGIASFLIELFEDMARNCGCTKILFDVVVGSPANFLYQKLGYRHWSNYMEKYL